MQFELRRLQSLFPAIYNLLEEIDQTTSFATTTTSTTTTTITTTSAPSLLPPQKYKSGSVDPNQWKEHLESQEPLQKHPDSQDLPRATIGTPRSTTQNRGTSRPHQGVECCPPTSRALNFQATLRGNNPALP